MLNSPFWRRLIIFASCLFLGGLVLGGILMPRAAFTHSTTPQERAAKAAEVQCSVATLKGTYVFAFDGHHIMGREHVLFALAGWASYDGRGHSRGVVSESVNGKISRLHHYTGTATVKPDCTATETVRDVTGVVSHYDEFITPDGSLVAFIQTDPGAVSSGTASRGTDK